GSLYVLYFDETKDQALWIARSADGGQSFAAPVKVAAAHRPPSPFPTSQFRMFLLPSLAINPPDAPLAISWNDSGAGNSDILPATSRDNGQTWSAPTRVNSDTGGADQFFPSVIFGPDGLMHLAWLDRRDDPRNLTFSTYYVQSTDDGATLTPNERI